MANRGGSVAAVVVLGALTTGCWPQSELCCLDDVSCAKVNLVEPRECGPGQTCVEQQCQTCVPTTARWQLPFDTLATVGRAISDGSVIVYSTTPIVLGDTALPPQSVARIGPDGTLVAMGTLQVPGYPVSLALDDLGGGVLQYSSDSTIAAFDAALRPAWTATPSALHALDMGPGGEVAYLTYPNYPSSAYLNYRRVDGTTWKTREESDVVRVTSTGDVFVFSMATQKRRVFSSQGMLVSEIATPGLGYPSFIARDGSVLKVSGTQLTRFAPSGAVEWTQEIGAYLEEPMIATNGDVLALVDNRSAVMRLDGATGALLARSTNCHDLGFTRVGQGILWADATGYVLLDDRGLARYDGP